MWILVIERGESGGQSAAAGVLRDLGCSVHVVDHRDLLPIDRSPPAVVLLEGGDAVGFARELLPALREAAWLERVPTIVAVTTRGLSQLDAADGFDDVVLMPYVPAELYLRIRRAEWKSGEFRDPERIKIGEVLIDPLGHEVSVAGRPVVLTQQEFALLVFLVERRGRVFSRSELLNEVWDRDYLGTDRTVDIHIRRLRKKLGTGNEILQNVRGVGYKARQP